jgi:hypothetical protein
MKVYIPKYEGGAGKYIYRGYYNAWKSLGYDVEEYFSIDKIIPPKEYYIMAPDAIISLSNIEIVEKSSKAFIFAQPTKFPKHWGTHPNFISVCPPEVKKEVISIPCTFWTFSNTKYSKKYFKEWNFKDDYPIYVPLAFDNIHYKETKSKEKVDVCFIGGIANNGFNEKIQIMQKFLYPVVRAGFSGIRVNANLSDEQELSLLSSAKVCLNLHDLYQQELGFDINERTFKSLGLNGCLVSDDVKEYTRLFGEKGCGSPEEFLSTVKDKINNPNIQEEKERNKNLIKENHTYKHRVIQLLNNEDFNNYSML